MSVFRRFVEVGRVVLLINGEDNGKLASIVDVVNQRRIMIEGPVTGVARQVVPISHVQLTDLVVKAPRACRSKALKNAWEKCDIVGQWNNSSWGQTLAGRQVRANLSDFERFKVMLAKKKANGIVKREVSRLVKSNN
eukprot:TRINITY_DN9821_c0_g1_i1.p1 TRINITY_DN9821_c0_g1~~TRINITY_DN9821_c0_g1_i1.p1  ORF type:complete len:137 (+),score=29.71 TRINITY_DN9821_c0_g1_i1:48-458(+)